jgi:endonuclease/exonuclease/phosphatase family metal-dependent hydrolase
VQLLSYNLFGLEERELDQRAEAAMFQTLLGGLPEAVWARDGVASPPPEVVCLQEVVPRTLAAHVRPHLGAAGYTLFVGSESSRSYFEVLAVRAPVEVVDHRVLPLENSQQGRELVAVRARIEGHTWLLLTGHLESLRPSSARRVAQASHVLAMLEAHGGPAVFAGDANLSERETPALGVCLDAWQVTGSSAASRYTWHAPRGRSRARFDRVWGHSVCFEAFSVGARGPIRAGGPEASDHLPLRVSVGPVGEDA